MYHEKNDSLLDTYARKLAANMNKGYEIDARVPSILIAGGSNFPTRKKEKQNAARDSNYREWQDIQGLLDKIRSTGMGGISADDPQAVQKLEKKLEVSIEKYSSLVDVIFDGKRMLWKVYILNLLQRLSQIIVTLFTFAALHGDLRKLPQLLATQIYVVMGSNCVPIPGGMGVTDYLMLKGYQQLMSREAAFQLEMLSRGLSFYVCIFVSLTAVLIGYVTIKRKKKLENENDRIL